MSATSGDVVLTTMESRNDTDILRGETITITLSKKTPGESVGISIQAPKEARGLMITAIEPGSLADSFGELKPGARLLDIKAAGELHRSPTLQQALELCSSSVGDLSLTIWPLVDRFGFIISSDELRAHPVTSIMLRLENVQLRKWRKRAATLQGWNEYRARKPAKWATRIRQGVPEPLRGFVWSLLAEGHAPEGFRQNGLYTDLCTRELPDGLQKWLDQIAKDVPRTMTDHIFFRQPGATGQAALGRVLHAYVAFRPALGYTQGMSSCEPSSPSNPMPAAFIHIW